MKPFDLEQVIKDRVNKEANEEWAKKEIPPFPVYKKCDTIKNNVGWRNLLRQLRP